MSCRECKSRVDFIMQSLQMMLTFLKNFSSASVEKLNSEDIVLCVDKSDCITLSASGKVFSKADDMVTTATPLPSGFPRLLVATQRSTAQRSTRQHSNTSATTVATTGGADDDAFTNRK